MRKINNQIEFNYSREYVIANSIAIEMYINIIVCGYYFKEHNYEFTANVLNNQYVTNGFRISLLDHVLDDSKEKNINLDKIRRLFKIRNIYAHNLPNEIKNEGVGRYVFSNPEGTDKAPIIAEEIADEFFTLHSEVEQYLSSEIEKGKFANSFKSEQALIYELGFDYKNL